MEIPRRSLLRASAAALTIGAAGCMNQETTDTTPDDGTTPSGGETGTPTPTDEQSIPDGMRSVLNTIPGSVVSDESTIWVSSPDSDPDNGLPTPMESEVLDRSTVGWSVTIFEDTPFRGGLTVATGEIDTDAVNGSHVRDEGSFSLYEHRGQTRGIIAVSDEMVVAGEESAVTSVVEAVADDPDEPLLEAHPAIETTLARLDGFHNRQVRPGTDLPGDLGLSADDVDKFGAGMEERENGQRDIKAVLLLGEGVDLTDEDREQVKAGFSETLPSELSDTSFSVDGNVVVFEFSYDPMQPMRDSSLRLGRGQYDPESGRLEVEVRAEEAKSVENLTLEVEGETYDPAIWADGRDTIESGDTVYIDEGDVKPHLEVTLTDEGEDGSSSSGRTFLNHLSFELNYDVQNRELHITYRHEFPLDGDEVYVGLSEAKAEDGQPARRPRPDAEITRTEQPWTGETVTEGTTATLSDIDPRQFLRIGYGGTDMEQRIFMRPIPIPVHARFDQEGEGVTIRLKTRTEDGAESLPADSFEVQVNNDPADTQWSDVGETVDPEATLELTDLDTGQIVTVYWNDIEIGQETVLPDVDLSFDFDAADGPTLSHDGGETLDPNRVTVMLLGKNSDEDPRVPLSEKVSGEFSEGDSVTFDRDGLEVVMVRYDDRNMLARFERPPHPAEVTFDIEDQTVTVTLKLDESYPADTFEVRIDRRPADTQWSDSQDTVSDGDSLTFENLEYGTRVSILAGEHDDEIGSVLVKPDVDLSFDFEAEDGPTLSHDGGEALDPGKVAVRLLGGGPLEPIPLDEKVSGQFSEGDSVTFDRSELHVALVMYDDEVIQEFTRNEQNEPDGESGGGSSGGNA
jgi:hypothetical protein